jgi:hypothetical protein
MLHSWQEFVWYEYAENIESTCEIICRVRATNAYHSMESVVSVRCTT